MTDLHVHTTFSSDGRSTLEEMVSAARARGMRYLGITEHFDREYLVQPVMIDGKAIVQTTDGEAYFPAARRMQAEYPALLVGAELGYFPHEAVFDAHGETIARYSPDFTINSVHTVGDCDCWAHEYFAGKDKKRAYGDYLRRVRLSLEAPYPYDIVGHLGYCCRNAPYEDRKMRAEEFPELEDILRTIVAKDKILEVNTARGGAGEGFLPDEEILSLYYALGGRLVSFASDAHHVSRLCEGREKVVSALKRIGFSAIAVPRRGERIFVPLA